MTRLSDILTHPLIPRLMPTLRGAVYVDEVRDMRELYVLEVAVEDGSRFVAASRDELPGLATLLNHLSSDDIFEGAFHVVRTTSPHYGLYYESGYAVEDAKTPTYAATTLNGDIFIELLDSISTPFVFETTFEDRAEALDHALQFLFAKCERRIYLQTDAEGVTVTWNEQPLHHNVTRIDAYALQNGQPVKLPRGASDV